jgi:hypothetical protein
MGKRQPFKSLLCAALCLISQFAVGGEGDAAPQKITLVTAIVFEPGSIALSADALSKLDSLNESLASINLQAIIVVEEVTPFGNFSAGQEDQQAITSTIKDYFVRHGVEASRVYTERRFVPATYGESTRKVRLAVVGTKIVQPAGSSVANTTEASLPVRTQADAAKISVAGALTLENGARYQGDVAGGNLAHGKGTMTYPNGDRYEGDFINGQLAGKGTYTWASGDRYEGDFANGQRTGKGVYTWANGGRYEGDFVSGQLTGKGTYTLPNGDRYEGDFVNGKRIGKDMVRQR